jgi:TolB-like protein
VNRVKLDLLGGFRLTGGDGRAVDIPAKKNRALIGILAMAPRGEVTRDRLTGLLWSDRGEEQAKGSLRQALVALRKDFAELGADPLLLNGEHVALDRNVVTFDVVEFLAASASTDPTELRRAADLYAGPFLDDLLASDNAFDEWLRDARADLASRAVRVLSTLAETLAGAERIAVAERLVAIEPLREASHLALMQAYIAQAQPALAVRQYETCKLLLKRELGVDPGEELQALRRTLDGISSTSPNAVASGGKPVIAVLPFENLSGDPEQQYFSDGITGDITERLTRFRAFAVIGQHSARAFRNVTDFAAIRETLKADFVVSGSVRRAGGRVRVAVRLSNAFSGESIWAQHYDRPVEDLFEVQDDVAHLVAAAVARLLEIEITARSGAKSPANLSSYEHILQGHWHFRKMTIASNLEARASFKRACQIDSRSAEAMSWLGVTYSNNWPNEFALDDAHCGATLCAEAVNLDPADAHCHAMLGFAELCVGNLDAAVRASARAVSLNPGDSHVLANRSYVAAYEGRTLEARQLLDRALKLNPVPPIWFGEFGGLIDFVGGRYEQALAGFELISEPAWDNMYALACYGNLGLAEKAKATLARLRRQGRNPDWFLGASREPFRDASVRERLLEGLNTALSF